MKNSDILEYIAGCDLEDLTELAEMIQIRRGHLSTRVRNKLHAGMTVEFDAGKRGRWIGTIQKVNRKKAKVLADPKDGWGGSGTVWNVPFTMLEVVG